MSEKLNCIVVDDDKVCQAILLGFIKKTDFLNLEGVFGDGIEAVNHLAKHSVDLIFLDIEMPEMTGIELLKTLQTLPEIVLTSKNDKYALDAFEYNVTDYLLKPIDNYPRFLKAVLRVKANIDSKNIPSTPETHKFFIKEDSKWINIDYREILYIEGYGDYLKVITDRKTHVIYGNMKDILNKLPDDFIQTHRSYIIRIDKIENLEGNIVRIGNKIIPMSRSCKEKVLTKIKTL